MADLEKALAKLEGENLQYGTPENEVREMVRLWCQADETAPALVLAKGKDCMGAYKKIYEYARGHKNIKGGAYVDPVTAMAIIMKYFGAGTQDEAHSRLEAGLMARIMQKQLEKWTTYTPTANPQPVATTSPASAPATKQPAFDLSALSLEDEL